MYKLIFATTMLLACSPGFAQTQAGQQPQQTQAQQTGGFVFEDDQPAAAKPKSANDRMICQDIKEPGSRLNSQRICMTALQWKQQQEHDRELVAQRQQQSTNPGAPGN